MGSEYAQSDHGDGSSHDAAWISTAPKPTIAAFSPDQQTAGHASRSSIIIHQKSPLLVATPPQVTRVLAYSHPFILPLNKLAGLVSWTTKDSWESFLLIMGFWFVVLYGDFVLQWAGPLVVVVGLIMGMYSRRFSPLSSTVWSGTKATHARQDAENTRKSLDEILDTLQTFTRRCEVLLNPFLRLTEFLSTQSTATQATTRPALTTLFVRILALIPIWIGLTLPPLSIITTRRVILTVGTIILSWHSRPARISRTILWRSRTVRKVSAIATGLDFTTLEVTETSPPSPPRDVHAKQLATSAKSSVVRFTFAIYENQRRWLGLGWTNSLFGYERQAWTDEHLNPCQDTAHFTLPETDRASTQWRWVEGSTWRIASTSGKKSNTEGQTSEHEEGWTYFDNKWTNPLKEDGWGRYTRHRKWIRDAELIEIPLEKDNVSIDNSASTNDRDTTDAATPKRRKGWFGRRASTESVARSVTGIDKSDAVSKTGGSVTGKSTRSRDDADHEAPVHHRYRNTESDRSIGDGLAEGLS